MNLDQFAFFNQQLAAMLRDGIPLEGALSQLSAGLGRGSFRAQVAGLESDLAQGMPLTEAVARRELPQLYKSLVLAGVKSNDLPGALTLLADFYQRKHSLQTRLKGLMVYPVLLLAAAFLLSLGLALLSRLVIFPAFADVLEGMFGGSALPGSTRFAMAMMEHPWVFPALFAVPLAVALMLVSIPRWRERLANRLPAFREAWLAQFAQTMMMLMKGGVPFPDAVQLVELLQTDPRIQGALATWRKNLAHGLTRFASVAGGGKAFPPLFVWLVDSSGEDVAGGFRQAGEIYEARAVHRSEVMLYAALPIAVLCVGMVVLAQAYLIASLWLAFVSLLGAIGG